MQWALCLSIVRYSPLVDERGTCRIVSSYSFQCFLEHYLRPSVVAIPTYQLISAPYLYLSWGVRREAKHTKKRPKKAFFSQSFINLLTMLRMWVITVIWSLHTCSFSPWWQANRHRKLLCLMLPEAKQIFLAWRERTCCSLQHPALPW